MLQVGSFLDTISKPTRPRFEPPRNDRSCIDGSKVEVGNVHIMPSPNNNPPPPPRNTLIINPPNVAQLQGISIVRGLGWFISSG